MLHSWVGVRWCLLEPPTPKLPNETEGLTETLERHVWFQKNQKRHSELQGTPLCQIPALGLPISADYCEAFGAAVPVCTKNQGGAISQYKISRTNSPKCMINTLCNRSSLSPSPSLPFSPYVCAHILMKMMKLYMVSPKHIKCVLLQHETCQQSNSLEKLLGFPNQNNDTYNTIGSFAAGNIRQGTKYLNQCFKTIKDNIITIMLSLTQIFLTLTMGKCILDSYAGL